MCWIIRFPFLCSCFRIGFFHVKDNVLSVYQLYRRDIFQGSFWAFSCRKFIRFLADGTIPNPIHVISISSKLKEKIETQLRRKVGGIQRNMLRKMFCENPLSFQWSSREVHISNVTEMCNQFYFCFWHCFLSRQSFDSSIRL